MVQGQDKYLFLSACIGRYPAFRNTLLMAF